MSGVKTVQFVGKAPSKRPLFPFATLGFMAVLAAWVASRAGKAGPAVDDPMDASPLTSPFLSPSESLASIQIVEGVSVSIAAAEPMVQAPVCGAFDEDGRLWVAEMQTYMRDVAATGEQIPDNRIVILEDTNGDGAFDTSVVIADKLVLPRGVAPCFGGALVIEPPNLVFLKDTDGDGKADSKRVLLSGFAGRDNPEHAGNGLVWGIDNWYEIAQHGVAVRFDGTSVQTRKTPVVGQWGLTRDDRGRLYYTPNSNALIADVFPKYLASRNPGRSGAAGIGELVCPDSTTHPIHPTPGVNRGYLPGTLRKDRTLAKLTAACSPAFYRADAMGEGFRNSVFVCEPAGNLVKRLVVREDDGVPRAENAYPDREFLASSDERFRPVGALVGPDGALYVLDMYRGVIQHRTYMTPYLRAQVKQRNLETPLSGGRVFRIAAANAVPAARPKLSRATDAELVSLLSHPDGWWRDTAQRLLVQRNAASVHAELAALATSHASPITRIHALWTMVPLGGLSEDTAEMLLGDPAPEVRAATAQILDGVASSVGIRSRLAALAGDPSRRVRMIAAATSANASESPSPSVVWDINSATDFLIRHGGDRFQRSALLCAIATREIEVLRALLADAAWPNSDGQRAVLTELADCSLAGSPTSRQALIELVGTLLEANDSRSGLLSSRVAHAMRLDSDNPRALKLLAEPKALVAAAVPDIRMAKIVLYLDWPGRGPVDRPRRARDLTEVERQVFERGRQLFSTCAGCHQEDGRGGAGLAAPLAGSARVHGRIDHLVRILSHGMQGSYLINGTEYWGVMPPAPLASDEEYAAVLTYIRRAWDNTADPVTPSQVGAIRSKLPKRSRTWTQEELELVGMPPSPASR